MASHRDIVAWQRAHAVAIGAYRYGATHWTAPCASAIEQLRRASLSVELNIVEGYAIGRSPRCKNHFRIALGSAAETSAILEFLVELEAPGGSALTELLDLSNQTRALVFRLWQRS